MTDGWVACPALGPGWRRREAFRKSGATCGRTDTYYQSPTGEKFRSKIELSRFLGPSHDLGNFDFKNGVEYSGPRKARKGPKWRPPPPEEAGPVGGAKRDEATPPAGQTTPPSEQTTPTPEQTTPPVGQTTPPRGETTPPGQATPPPALSPPPPPAEATPPPVATPPPPPLLRPLPLRRTRKRPLPPPQPPQEGGEVVCCGGCQGLFPGVTLPPQRRVRWLCPACRARRRDFNREQRFFKRVGCGSCSACRIPADCGICSACAQPPPPAPQPPPKCLLRRCLRIVKKGVGCGSCPGCVATEDCGSCCICLRRLKPGLKRQWRCLRRRCLHPKRSGVAKKTTHGPPKPTVKWKPPLEPSIRPRKQLLKGKEKKKPGRPPKHPGGSGEKEQPGGGGEKVGGPPPRPPLRLGPPRLKEEPGPLPCLEPPPGDLGVLIAATPPVKQEPLPPPSASLVPVLPRLPPPARLVLLDEEEEEEGGGGRRVPLPLLPRPPSPPPPPQPPQPPSLWPGAFLAELAEIPLPAHWGVVGGGEADEAEAEEAGGGHLPPHLPPRRGGLRLIQRSPRSPMAATVVVLAPGLAFRVLVARGRPLPPCHEVLARRPPRLRSVDDLVELLCDLEAYRPCPGPPGPLPLPPAPRCQVLVVPGGRCCPPCLRLGGGGE